MKGKKLIFTIFYLLVVADNIVALDDLVHTTIYTFKTIGLIFVRLLIVACFVSMAVRNIVVKEH
ncbi:MAG: hypothetical protein ACHQET_11885 [Chitinophagales bacterium]